MVAACPRLRRSSHALHRRRLTYGRMLLMNYFSSLDLLRIVRRTAVKYVVGEIRCSPEFLEAFAWPIIPFFLSSANTTLMGGPCHLFVTLFSDFP